MAILWERIEDRKKRPPPPRTVPPPEPPQSKPTRARTTKPPPPRTVQTVDRVIDGQSLVTGAGECIRLARIEAAPVETLEGTAAKRWLAAYCSPGITLTLERKRCDEQGRSVAEIFVLGRNVSDLMLKSSAVSRIRKTEMSA